MTDHEGTRPTKAAEAGASRLADPVIEIASVEPRIFGAVPPALALVLGVAGLVAGLALLVSGGVPAGLILLGAGGILLALAIDAARRWPTSAVPRALVRVSDALRGRLGLARVSAGAWSAAGREVISLRGELRDLRSVRDAHLLELGLAAYQEDAAEVNVLRIEISDLDGSIGDRERELTAAVGRAKERVKRKRAAVQPTQSFAVPETRPPLEDDDTRTAPTAERPFPSAGSS